MKNNYNFLLFFLWIWIFLILHDVNYTSIDSSETYFNKLFNIYFDHVWIMTMSEVRDKFDSQFKKRFHALIKELDC